MYDTILVDIQLGFRSQYPMKVGAAYMLVQNYFTTERADQRNSGDLINFLGTLLNNGSHYFL